MKVVKAVQGRIPVFLDGGVRRGTDVFKALALGASGVFVSVYINVKSPFYGYIKSIGLSIFHGNKWVWILWIAREALFNL